LGYIRDVILRDKQRRGRSERAEKGLRHANENPKTAPRFKTTTTTIALVERREESRHSDTRRASVDLIFFNAICCSLADSLLTVSVQMMAERSHSGKSERNEKS
jgi:hypothetical protein